MTAIKRVFHAAASAIAVSGLPFAAHAASYAITDISVANATLKFSDINNSGQIAGVIYDNNTNTTSVYTRINGIGTNIAVPYPSSYVSINNNGWFAGTTYNTQNYMTSGFLRAPGGPTTTYSVPGSAVNQTFINDSQQVAGTSVSYSGTESAFLRDTNGSISTFAVSGAMDTLAVGISNAGVVAGWAFLPNYTSESFIRTTDGMLTTFSLANASSTYVAGISDSGLIVGTAGTSSGQEGFIRQLDGQFTTFTITGAGILPDSFAIAGINDAGQITGTVRAASGGWTESFVRNANGSVDFLTLPGENLYAQAINNAGTVVGTAGNDGFVAQINPVPLPGAGLLFSSAMICIGALGRRQLKRAA